MFTGQNRFCPEAVGSMQSVAACPTTKTEWDSAALKKNCSKLAPLQNCVPVNKFKYHCVINGLRNQLVEVCAPERIIFGIFNLLWSRIHFYNFFYLILLIKSHFWNCDICTIFRTLCRIQCSWWSYSRPEISSLQQKVS